MDETVISLTSDEAKEVLLALQERSDKVYAAMKHHRTSAKDAFALKNEWRIIAAVRLQLADAMDQAIASRKAEV